MLSGKNQKNDMEINMSKPFPSSHHEGKKMLQISEITFFSYQFLNKKNFSRTQNSLFFALRDCLAYKNKSLNNRHDDEKIRELRRCNNQIFIIFVLFFLVYLSLLLSVCYEKIFVVLCCFLFIYFILKHHHAALKCMHRILSDCYSCKLNIRCNC